MPSDRIQVRVRASTGAVGVGAVAVGHPTLARRALWAGLLLAAGLAAAVLLLPVPLAHFFGIAFFFGMAYLAARRLMSRTVLREASGVCPACGQEGRFFVGFGGRPFRLPVGTSCGACAMGLRLEPDEGI